MPLFRRSSTKLSLAFLFEAKAKSCHCFDAELVVLAVLAVLAEALSSWLLALALDSSKVPARDFAVVTSTVWNSCDELFEATAASRLALDEQSAAAAVESAT